MLSAAAALGCEKLDHTACDELCKADGFWYGHCSHWDGRDFQCTCYEYKKPLDPSICSDMQEQCLQECKDKVCLFLQGAFEQLVFWSGWLTEEFRDSKAATAIRIQVPQNRVALQPAIALRSFLLLEDVNIVNHLTYGSFCTCPLHEGGL